MVVFWPKIVMIFTKKMGFDIILYINLPQKCYLIFTIFELFVPPSPDQAKIWLKIPYIKWPGHKTAKNAQITLNVKKDSVVIWHFYTNTV